MKTDLLNSKPATAERPGAIRQPVTRAKSATQLSWKRRGLARLLAASGFLRSIGSVVNPPAAEVRILAYHRVWDLDSEDRFPYDVELVSASTKDFAWQMQYVREHFDPITFRQLLAGIDGVQPLPARPLIVTFDDGYEDNYIHAFPILKELNVPATIFLATDYIGRETTFWYDRLAHLILTTERRSLEVDWRADLLPLGTVADRRQAVRDVLGVLKRIPNELRLQALQQFEMDLGGHLRPDGSRLSRPMTWEQVREMSALGIEFGSHTCSHPILANLTDAELRYEVLESRRTIERETGQPSEVLSYPVGGRTAFDDRVQKALQKAAYRLGVAYLPGTNPMARLDHFGLKRLRIERYVTREYFQAMLHLPKWFA